MEDGPKYMYMLYVYMCVRGFCPIVDRLDRPGEAGEDAASGGRNEERSRAEPRRGWDEAHTV
ncbi:hypothetical protein HanIR_Chr10g0494911 [Helianthus annuus]|nr:hypothetical protein HanIR_Chr10g0494911 [Helianthus annuus]